MWACIWNCNSRKGVVICEYPYDPTVVLGYLSVGFLVASTVAGCNAGLALAFLLWPTITEQLHLIRNIHHNLRTDCPIAKTGLLGGGAFLSLNTSLFWLVSLMLADNAREDYFDEVEGVKGELGSFPGLDYEVDGGIKA
ncbi:unnamed protein product [Thlaspi arvense]|uniref:Uncharacterized protein n=1 Tax=Thlaspi arvense TaxID=13288 RepID=A0AAU9S3T5_THLAR|nr:unnamed protein product [Thlaspi arvense]